MEQVRLAAIVFAVIIAVLVAIYFFAFRQNYTVLFDNLEPAEAAAVVAELDKQKATYKLGNGGAQILVPEGKHDALRLSIAGSNLPLHGLEGFELFNESDMGLTDFAQKIKYQRALQGELARTIMMIDGVEDARVHIAMPERALFRGAQNTTKAAVTLVMRAPEYETPASIEGVQRLVAAAVPDLLTSDVVVLNAHGEVISPRVAVLPPRGDSSGTTAPRNPHLDRAIAATRRVLPDVRFDLRVEENPKAASAALDGDENEITAAGEPVEATPPPSFAAIHVHTEAPLSPDLQTRLRAEFVQSNLIDANSAVALVFHIGLPQAIDAIAADGSQAGVNAPAALAPRSEAARDENTPPSPSLINWIIGGLGVVIVVVFAALIFFMRRNRARLSLDDQRAFAERLKLGLQSSPAGDELAA
ncbi:MAG: flagellar basal-body MS-ring/collar protein FliF [Caulobacterales bacterium]